MAHAPESRGAETIRTRWARRAPAGVPTGAVGMGWLGVAVAWTLTGRASARVLVDRNQLARETGSGFGRRANFTHGVCRPLRAAFEQIAVSQDGHEDVI